MNRKAKLLKNVMIVAISFFLLSACADLTETDAFAEPVPEEVPVLNLPESFNIEMTITDKGKYAHSQEYRMVSCNEGVYFYSSDTGTENVFERLENGRYIQYQKRPGSKGYDTPNISAPLWEQIKAGNVSLDSVSCDGNMIHGISSVFMNELNSYEALRSQLIYEATEEINGHLCYKYCAEIKNFGGKTKEQYWIDTQSVICIR